MTLFDNLLTTHNLSIGYQNKKKVSTVYNNINICLKKGQLTAIVGANGIGKSTLLKTITGIQKPVKGTVHLNQKILHNISTNNLAQNLSVVLTEKLPPSNLTVYELIALGRQPYTNWIGNLTDTDTEKINEAVALTQTEHLLNKKHFEISDGQLQIVLIARALSQDTPLIILDEPTTHLDLPHKISLIKLLKKLTHEANKCILYSTHDIDLAIQLSDEIIVMTPDAILQDTPCNHISKGNFNALFNDDSIVFDSQKGKFVIL